MKRSLSNPSLSSSTKKVTIPRNISVPASLVNIANDIVLEIQAEAITHTPAYVAAACGSSSHVFPLDLINKQNEVSEAAVFDIGACIACPPDGECTSSWDDEGAPRRQLAWMLGESRKKSRKKESVKKG